MVEKDPDASAEPEYPCFECKGPATANTWFCSEDCRVIFHTRRNLRMGRWDE